MTRLQFCESMASAKFAQRESKRSRVLLEAPLSRGAEVQAECFLGRTSSCLGAALRETEDHCSSSRFMLTERYFCVAESSLLGNAQESYLAVSSRVASKRAMRAWHSRRPRT